MFCKVWEQVIERFGAAITKKTAIFAEKSRKKNAFLWPKTVFFGPEWSFVGPHTLFSGCWTHKNVCCNFLERIMKAFRAAITRKPHCLAKNGRKMPFFGLKQYFSGLNGQRWGPIPYYEGAGIRKACMAGFWSK